MKSIRPVNLSKSHGSTTTSTYQSLQFKIGQMQKQGHKLLFRADSQKIETLIQGLESKGQKHKIVETDLEVHVNSNPHNSAYISTARTKYQAISLGTPSFTDGIAPNFKIVTTTMPSVVTWTHMNPKIQAMLDDKGNLKSVPYEIVSGVPVANFGAVEGETAVPFIKDQDIVGIETRIGVGSLSFPYQTFTFLNEKHAPSSVVTQVLSLNEAQAELWEKQLHNIGKLPKDKRYIKAHEISYDFGRLTDVYSQKQLFIQTVPADLPSRLVAEYVHDLHQEHKKKHTGIASILDVVEDVKHKGVFTGLSPFTMFSLFGNKTPASVIKPVAEEPKSTPKKSP